MIHYPRGRKEALRFPRHGRAPKSNCPISFARDISGGLIYGRRMPHGSLYFLSSLLRPWRIGITVVLGAVALFFVAFFLA